MAAMFERHRADMTIAEENFSDRLRSALLDKQEEMDRLCAAKLANQAFELDEKHQKAMLQATVDFDFKCHTQKTDYEKKTADLKKKAEEVSLPR
jgi:hypothetical protein